MSPGRGNVRAHVLPYLVSGAFARYENNAGYGSLGIQDWTEEVDDVARAIDNSEDEETLGFEREKNKVIHMNDTLVSNLSTIDFFLVSFLNYVEVSL